MKQSYTLQFGNYDIRIGFPGNSHVTTEVFLCDTLTYNATLDDEEQAIQYALDRIARNIRFDVSQMRQRLDEGDDATRGLANLAAQMIRAE